MKKTYLNSFCARCLTLLILALLSTNLAWGEDATDTWVFTSQQFATTLNGNATTDSWSVTDGDKTVSSATGYNDSKGFQTTVEKLVLTCSKKYSNIKSVVISYSTNSNSTAKLSVKAGSNTASEQQVQKSKTNADITFNFSATENDQEVVINYEKNGGSGSLYIKTIKITYSATTEIISVTGISLDQTTASVQRTKKITLNPTITPSDATNKEVTWSSSKEDIATVDENGVVTGVAEGTATITATTNDGNYTATCDVTITPFIQTYASTYTSNVELTTTGGISASAAKVIIDEVEYDAIKVGTGKVQGACVVTIPAATKTLHFHAAGWNGETVVLNKTFNLVADAGVSNNTPFTLQNNPEENDYFTLDPKGATEITFTATSDNRFVLFGVNAELFEAQDVTITDVGWATACLPFNATITSDNATAYYVTGTEGNVLTKVEADVIPAGEGILLKSNDGGEATIKFTESAKDADAATGNMMKGAITETTFKEDGYKYYILANGDNGLGFYYQGTENDGSTVKCAAGKAVLAVPTTSGAKAFFSLDNEPTGITSYENDNENLKAMTVYNLNGMKVNNSYKGIVIMNGKKYINK